MSELHASFCLCMYCRCSNKPDLYQWCRQFRRCAVLRALFRCRSDFCVLSCLCPPVQTSTHVLPTSNMGSTQVYHDQEFLKEVWGLFGVGCCVLVLRFIVRLRTVGIRNFQGDDYISMLVLLCYTADAVTVTLTYLNGSNVDYTPEALTKLSKQENDQVIFGSRMQLFAVCGRHRRSARCMLTHIRVPVVHIHRAHMGS